MEDEPGSGALRRLIGSRDPHRPDEDVAPSLRRLFEQPGHGGTAEEGLETEGARL